RAGRHAADERNLDQVFVAAGRADRALRPNWAQRARLQVLALEVPLLLERAQVVVHPVRRADPELKADLAQGRGVAALADRLGDELQNLALAIGENAPRVVAYESQRAHPFLLEISPVT